MAAFPFATQVRAQCFSSRRERALLGGRRISMSGRDDWIVATVATVLRPPMVGLPCEICADTDAEVMDVASAREITSFVVSLLTRCKASIRRRSIESSRVQLSTSMCL